MQINKTGRTSNEAARKDVFQKCDSYFLEKDADSQAIAKVFFASDTRARRASLRSAIRQYVAGARQSSITVFLCPIIGGGRYV
jgi:hypothetical protein